MKLNIANPQRGLQKCFDITKTAEMKFYDKKIGDMFEGELINPDFAGYTLKITGGDDHQGFPMKTRVNTTKRLRLLLKKGEKGYRCKRAGCRRRKSVRGSIISAEIAIISCIILQEGPKEIPGISDKIVEQSHLPKRADKLRKMFGIGEEEDLKKVVKSIVYGSKVEGQKMRMPRIRITRLPNPEKERKKEVELVERQKRKEKLKAERMEYERKFGKINA